MWKQKYRKIVAGTLATLTFLLQMPLELLAQNLYDSAEENYQQISQKAEEESLTLDELSQTNILPTTRRNRGVVESPLDLNTHRPTNRNTRGELIGFYGANSLRDDSSPVSVIVVFNEAPLAVQRALEAQPQRANQRITLSLDAAAAIEAERQLFHEELGSLISYASAQTNSNSPNPVSVNREFSHAFNGVSLTLPSNTVEYLASFESVSIVFPDQIYQLDPILIGDEIEEDLIAFSQSNPIGVRLGRERMNAHILHEMGYRGQGILMAILDTGVYTYHPAFAGSFPTQADMAARGVNIPNSYLLYVQGEGYVFVGRDYLVTLAGGGWLNNPLRNNPMETSPLHHPNSTQAQWTNHGTHVAAIAMGRSENLIGIAPESLAIHYRVLGPGGGTAVDIIAAMEHASVYMGADVVNLSLGPNAPTPLLNATTIAVNNLSLATDSIFVFAAGNSGPNYSTSWGGGNSTFAVNVANIAEEPSQASLYINSQTLDNTEFFMMTGFHSLRTLPNGAIVSTEPGAFYTETGEMRIFALPATPGSPAGAGYTPETAPPVGAGNINDFQALYELHGREALMGAWVIVRRGNAFTDTRANARDLNLAGVILINTSTQAMITSGGDTLELPMVTAPSAYGRALVQEILNSETGYSKFSFPRFTQREFPMRLAGSSSRGPSNLSLEISPEIGAHGSDVISAMPPWDVGWRVSPNARTVTFHAQGEDVTIVPSQFSFDPYERASFYDTAYLPATGTSMAAPMVAGGIALMLQYSNNSWDRAEVRARLMNSAIPIQYSENLAGVASATSVFEAGAGQADLLAAINQDVVVNVYFDAFHTGGARIPTPTGAFSFGGINSYGAAYSTLEGTIRNRSGSSQTFTFRYVPITGARNSVAGEHFLQLPSSVTVPAGGVSNFEVTMFLTGTTVGHHEGFVEVLSGSEVVARLPYGAVSYFDPPAPALMYNTFLARSIISASENRHHLRSGNITAYFTPYADFWSDLFLYRINADGSEDFLGLVDHIDMHNFAGLGQQYRLDLFTIGANPQDWTEGDYVLVWDILHPISAYLDITHRLYFSIDNTPPELSDVEIEQIQYEYEYGYKIKFLVTGIVSDEFLELAIARNQTNDIWTGLHGPQITLASNLAVFALVGENGEYNRPVRAIVEEDGQFSALIPITDFNYGYELTLFALDNYSLVPHWYSGGATTALRQPFFSLYPPNALLLADYETQEYTEFGWFHNFGLTAFNRFLLSQSNWAGNNITIYTTAPEEPIETIYLVEDVLLLTEVITTNEEIYEAGILGNTLYVEFTQNGYFVSGFGAFYRLPNDETEEKQLITNIEFEELINIASAPYFEDRQILPILSFPLFNPPLFENGDYVIVWYIFYPFSQDVNIYHRIYFEIYNGTEDYLSSDRLPEENEKDYPEDEYEIDEEDYKEDEETEEENEYEVDEKDYPEEDEENETEEEPQLEEEIIEEAPELEEIVTPEPEFIETPIAPAANFVPLASFNITPLSQFNQDGSFEVTTLLARSLGRYMPTAEREGYKFLGWNFEEDGSGEFFTATTPVINNIHVFAIFERIPIILVEDPFLVETVLTSHPQVQNRGRILTADFIQNGHFAAGLRFYIISLAGEQFITEVSSVEELQQLQGIAALNENSPQFGERHQLNLFTIPLSPQMFPAGEWVLVWNVFYPGTQTLNISHRLYFEIDNTLTGAYRPILEEDEEETPALVRPTQPDRAPTLNLPIVSSVGRPSLRHLQRLELERLSPVLVVEYQPIILEPQPIVELINFTPSIAVWYASYLAVVNSLGIFNIAQDLFNPQIPTTRAEFVQKLFNLSSNFDYEAEPITSLSFNDVPSNFAYYEAISWAASVGLVVGIGHGNFAPNDLITREQMAILFVNFASLFELQLEEIADTEQFYDLSEISYWAEEAVAILQSANVLQGRPGGIFDPSTNASQAEVAAAFARFITNLS